METTVSIWPAIIWIALMSVKATVHALYNNKPKGKYDIYGFLFVHLPVMTALLWWGNFFAPLGWGV